jgi:hypothetical protein
MAALSPRLRLAGLLAVAFVVATGCNPLLFPYLFNGEPKQPAAFKHLTNKDRPVRVVVISYAGASDNSPESVGADRELCRKLVKRLLDATRETKEKIDLVAPKTIDKFKDEHPDWYKMDLKTVGDYFKADYVIYLEMEALNLMESGNLMFRGRTEINVLLADMHDAVGEPDRKVYKAEFPKHGPVPVSDTNAAQFRDTFLEYVANQLSWLFTDHASANQTEITIE